MRRTILVVFVSIWQWLVSPTFAGAEIFVRVNQLGYRPGGDKIAMAFSLNALPEEFAVCEADTGKVCYTGRAAPVRNTVWGRFSLHSELAFSGLEAPGRYVIKCGSGRSPGLAIGETVDAEFPRQLLQFMRQQRCGFNPWLDAACHPFDGRSAYGPLTNGTYVDASGGWHDAADLLKYLLTSGNATAQMLLAYDLAHTAKSSAAETDRCDRWGQAGGNGVPDLLDEARWGLDWMLKLHPAPDQLAHQVADDRDHAGRRLPQNENIDYGWGKGGSRVVYFADGRPQGLQSYRSASTGLANLAGRYAAAMALAYQVWKDDPRQRWFAERCLQAGREVFELGLAKLGVQQGNSYKAPYRYEETTWADDMEWGAAELYRATSDSGYLEHARRFAIQAADESWMGHEKTGHYQYYPFMNLGHYRLHGLVDREFQQKLEGFYRQGIERCVSAGGKNPYRLGVPFIWCSNNLLTALATQCILYERMSGDSRYRAFTAAQQDWLLGRNPWGYTMFLGIGGQAPRHPHLMTMELTGRPVPGGLVDGPVYESIFKTLKGVTITEPDPLSIFQGPAVYHDDSQDYSSNEPTMDGTASAILLWAAWQGAPALR